MFKLFRRILMFMALSTAAAPVFAGASVNVFLDFAPPAARYEPQPAYRAGHVWSPGYWAWHGHRHVWVSGNWLQARPGHVWHAANWVPAGHGWRFSPGYWEPHAIGYRYRDSDRDGIPDYRDRTPYGRYYHRGPHDSRWGRGRDRDRDGIPDYRDPFPRDRDNDGRPDRWDRYPYDPRR